MKRLGFIIPFLVFILVFSFACSGTVHKEAAWEKAVKQNTSDGYKEYLEENPGGKYAFLFSLEPVVNSQGISDAAAYSPDKPGPHRLVILDASGKYHLLNKMLPSNWQPSSIGEIELLAVIVNDDWVTVNSRKYFDTNKGLDVTIDSKQHEMDIEIMEAKTGILLETKNFKGSYPQAPITKTDNNEIMGFRVDPESIKIYLGKWIAAGTDISSTESNSTEDWKKFSGSDFELYLPDTWEGGSREQFELLIDKLKQKKEPKLAGAIEAFPSDLLFWAYSRQEGILAQVDIYKELQIDLELIDFWETHYNEKAEKYEKIGWRLAIIDDKLNFIASTNFEEAVRTTSLRTSPDKNIVVEYLLKDGPDFWILTFSVDSEEIDKFIDIFDRAVETFSVNK